MTSLPHSSHPHPLTPSPPLPQSCPAIQVYSAHNLERGLHSAATNFCSQEVGVASGSVSLSMIFRWYAVDFGSSDRELLQ